jgi:hypothetical protein
MGFMDWLLGSKPNPTIGQPSLDFMDEVRNSMPGIGGAARASKKLWKQYLDDPESLATQSLNQGAVERQTAAEDYAQGDNALLAHSGNEGQASLLQRMKENRIAKINQAQGISAQQEAAQKGFGALEGWQTGITNRDANTTARYGIMGNTLNGGRFDNRRQGGALSGILGGVINGFACWVAQACYGINSFETMLLRHWINNVWTSRTGRLFLKLYLRFGERAAELVKRSLLLRAIARFGFDRLLTRALR